ncbi:MAG: alpha/beta hydrolase [Pseudomonadales bacterium]|jgi:pimeloyl-ACP methyl ester carboxylesterase|nr:alpha/beta hydrolase [Pseudomonadales bacterium]MDP6317195.1 alpha/beta hydrolase [Pseudomonadales bacterium]MDP7314146.1 alpha/beta hydrolase [Pseudomonadales bacterium]MDP7451283.1 alpha/beta hydrolase [Arenicellales bacterium]|tara:strand:+ start:49 stop:1545 length:1497 start_codon:yes stop_codon:yes gene_type:complete
MSHRLLLACSLLLAGCGLGVDQSTLVKPNYDLLTRCERPERAEITGIVSESLCGTISVYEDRVSQQGRKIDLNIMLIPASTAVVKPDPIFFLAGGPGQSAVQVGPYVFTLLSKLRRERDVVLVDQRGTGMSNSLACEADIEGELLDVTLDEAAAIQLEMMRDCLSEYDANPALYTTPVAMDDLNEVREVLGYRDVNIIGGSYGTRAALVYLRRHKDSVRSIVLDGVAPLTIPIPANIALDAQSAFELLLADCEAQERCFAAFPDLEEHFRALVVDLKQNPRTETIVHPRTGESITGPVDPLIINRLVRAVMYDRTVSSLLPLAIEQAYQGNFQPLVTLGYSFTGDGSDMSAGMMASVLCSEDMRRVSQPGHSEDFDNAIYALLEPVCEFWPMGEIPEDYFEPVVSDVPVLLLSGKLDPVTPPKYGWEASATLSNSEHIVVPGVGHGTMLQGCVPDLLEDFIINRSAKTAKLGCVSDLSRPPFFTSFAGPTALDSEGDQ